MLLIFLHKPKLVKILLPSQIAGFFKVYYCVKEVMDKLDFLHGDAHQWSLQVHFVFFVVVVKLHRTTNLQFLRSSLLGFLDFLGANGPPKAGADLQLILGRYTNFGDT